MDIKGNINSIETFGAVDGPGVRYIVFLQGCRMRCRYCHNPETWAIHIEGRSGENSTKERAGGEGTSTGAIGGGGNGEVLRLRDPSYQETAEETFKKAWRYHTYWKNGGGITVSGGEAMLQMDYVTELFGICREKHVNTALDTAGQPFHREPAFLERFDRLMEVTDLFILDIKQIDPEKHKKLTGWTNENILDLAVYLAEHHKKMWIRHVLVPGITTDEGDLVKLRAFLDHLRDIDPGCIDRVEVLPYHTMGIPKYEKLGIPYPLENTEPPTAEQVATAESILNSGQK